MKGSLLLVEIDPVVLPEGVLMGGKTELSGDDEVVAVRECNDEIERGISLVYAGLLLVEGEGKRWMEVDKETKNERLRFPVAEDDKAAGATTTSNESLKEMDDEFFVEIVILQ